MSREFLKGDVVMYFQPCKVASSARDYDYQDLRTGTVTGRTRLDIQNETEYEIETSNGTAVHISAAALHEANPWQPS